MGRLVLLIIISLVSTGVFAVEKGGVEYTPYSIDHSKLDLTTLEQEAVQYYTLSTTATTKEDVDKYTTYALGAYKLLFDAKPDNINYCLKIAELYDKNGKNRYAKEYYYRAITLNPDSALPFEGFGNFYFSRADYRRALKQYIQAYNRDSNIQNVNNRLGIIYTKLGDTDAALKFTKQGSTNSKNMDTSNKIRLLEELNSSNAVYYQNTRVHFVED